jgi:hypothetical protein
MNNNNIAETILNQIGGNQFIAMTGSSHFASTGNGLRMKLSRNKSGANYLFIELNGRDLYNMKFSSIRSKNWEIVSKTKFDIQDVYADQMFRIFEQITGLYTKLY